MYCHNLFVIFITCSTEYPAFFKEVGTVWNYVLCSLYFSLSKIWYSHMTTYRKHASRRTQFPRDFEYRQFSTTEDKISITLRNINVDETVTITRLVLYVPRCWTRRVLLLYIKRATTTHYNTIYKVSVSPSYTDVSSAATEPRDTTSNLSSYRETLLLTPC